MIEVSILNNADNFSKNEQKRLELFVLPFHL